MSEKGIRYIFNDYILLHNPTIISIIEEILDITNLQIYWFDLPTDFINNFSDRIFRCSLDDLIQDNRYSKEIEFNKIKNLINSNRWQETRDILLYLNFTITIPSDNKLLSELNFYDASLIKPVNIENNTDSEKSFDHLKNGYLSKEDIPYIKERKMSVVEVAGYPDGWYCTFSDLSLFEIYDNEDINLNCKEILYNAITGKIRSISMFGNLYHFVGNVPLFSKRYLNGKDIKKIFNSFLDFLEISFLKDWEIERQ